MLNPGLSEPWVQKYMVLLNKNYIKKKKKKIDKKNMCIFTLFFILCEISSVSDIMLFPNKILNLFIEALDLTGRKIRIKNSADQLLKIENGLIPSGSNSEKMLFII